MSTCALLRPSPSAWLWTFAILALLTSGCVAPQRPLTWQGRAPELPPPQHDKTPAAAPACEQIVDIEVRKSERTLIARCARGATVAMAVALGRVPLGHKQASGDMRTPEGRYRVSGTPEASRFRAFVPIDYPSVQDADRALADGRIDAWDHQRIVDAHERHAHPPSDTPLGGQIGLHGEGQRWAGDSAHLDWTLGCLAVEDSDLDFLMSRIQPGVPVQILP